MSFVNVRVIKYVVGNSPVVSNNGKKLKILSLMSFKFVQRVPASHLTLRT